MKVVIFGCGGHGRVVLDILRLRGDVEVVGFVDDRHPAGGPDVGGLPVLGALDCLAALPTEGVEGCVVAIGDNRVRAEKFAALAAAGLTPASAIHPSVILAETVECGAGLQAMAGVIVNTGARIGHNVILNTGCTVDHDCRIGDHAFVGPGAHLGGNVTVGESAFVGVGASVIPRIIIGEGSVIGAGASVVDDVPPGVVAVGVPAKTIRGLHPGP